MARSSVREYAINYIGGKKSSSSSTIGGGASVLSTGSHDLDSPNHPGLLPTTKVSSGANDGEGLLLAPDSLGGVEWVSALPLRVIPAGVTYSVGVNGSLVVIGPLVLELDAVLSLADGSAALVL
jgi:hypothetical protein